MRRITITSLTNNADADALETARAALTGASGRPVLPSAQVSFTAIASTSTQGPEQFSSGDLVGFAYMPLTINAAGDVLTREWARWKGGDVAIVQGARMVVSGPLDVPPGATAVIALPLAVVDTNASAPSTFACGIFAHVPSTIG